MMPTESTLPSRARAAYERGRWRTAAAEALWLVPFIALAVRHCTHLSIGCVASLALLACVGTLRWRGGIWGRAAVVGAIAALPALLMPLLLPCCIDCPPNLSAQTCGLLCGTLGLFSGALLGSWSARQGTDRHRALIGGGLVLAACSALGCDMVGLAAIGGLWIGATVATASALSWARA